MTPTACEDCDLARVPNLRTTEYAPIVSKSDLGSRAG